MTSSLLMIVAAGSYVLAWFLIALKEDKERATLSPITLRGWEAFGFALSSNWPSQRHSSEWLEILLSKLSALSNFVFIGVLVRVYFSGSPSSYPVLQATLLVCAILNTHWLRSRYRDDLRSGYYLWVGSFFLLAAGLAVTTLTFSVISATTVLAASVAVGMRLTSRADASVDRDLKYRQARATAQELRGNKMDNSTKSSETRSTRSYPAPEKVGSPEERTFVNEDDSPHSNDNWGTALLKYLVHPFTLTATPLFLFALLVFFVVREFQKNLDVGIRSLCGALLPLILITFIHEFRRDLLEQLGSKGILWSFIFSSIWGFGLMFTLKLLNFYLKIQYIPLSEVILSSSFSVLVFTYYDDEKNKAKAYYYGMLVGLLIYIIAVGFPIDILHRT
jgi:hypothetical protein